VDGDPMDRVLLGVGAVALALLRGEGADALVAEVGAIADVLHDRYAQGQIDDMAQWQALVSGDHARMLELALAAAPSDPLNAPTYYLRAARAALWLEDAASAGRALRDFAALGRGAPVPAALLATGRAGLAALEGRRGEAIVAYADAVERWRALGCRFDLGLCQLDAARLLGPETPEGATAAEEARRIFEQLGSPPYLAMVEALVQGRGVRTTR
jgi:hypothetical protein